MVCIKPPLCLAFSPDHPGSCSYTKANLPATLPATARSLSPSGGRRPPSAPLKRSGSCRGCGLSSAHPSRKHSLTAAVFLRKLAKHVGHGAGVLIVTLFPPVADDFVPARLVLQEGNGAIVPPGKILGTILSCQGDGVYPRFGCWKRIGACLIPVHPPSCAVMPSWG